MCKVTVIVPLYELTPEGKRAILSVERQSIREDVELIILDLRSEKMKIEETDISSYFEDVRIKPQILSADLKRPYQAWNEAMQAVNGAYLLFLAQNCVLTKDILEILYSRAEKREADVLIGNVAKQRGRTIDVESIIGEKLSGDETINLTTRKDVLLADTFLYNKFMRTNTVRASGAIFTKQSTNKRFLNQIADSSQNIFLIDREICLCGDKRIYEYRNRTVKDYARSVVRRAKKILH